MKKLQGILCFGIAVAMLLVPGMAKADTVTCDGITDQQGLTAALNATDNACTTITLGGDVELSSTVAVTKEVTINGNGHTIKGSDSWNSQGNLSGDQSLLTASNSAAKLTLVNVKLTKSPKYGVQSFKGATVILNGVTIEDCKFGGVLANGGTVQVKDLTLGHNGETDNNGIEISVGSSAQGSTPKVVLDGKITSSENENVIYVAENDGNRLTTFDVESTENSEEKIYVNDGKVVVTDKDNKVLYESNKVDKVTAHNTSSDAVTMYIVTIKYGDKTEQFAVERNFTLKDLDLDSIKNAIDGKTFVNFTDEDGKVFAEDTKITANITLTATYKDKEVPTTTAATTVVTTTAAKVTNPKTLDNVLTYVSLGILSMTVIAFAGYKTYKKVNN